MVDISRYPVSIRLAPIFRCDYDQFGESVLLMCLTYCHKQLMVFAMNLEIT